jgi:hypothetical protein
MNTDTTSEPTAQTSQLEPSENAENFQLSTFQFAGRELWNADFESREEFQIEHCCDGEPAFEFTGDSMRFDTGAPGDGMTIWYPQTFPGDLIMTYDVSYNDETKTYESNHGEMIGGDRNFNCFFAASAENGEPDALRDAGLGGDYSEYHEIPNYTFTSTASHSRLRKNPGFDLISDFKFGVGNEFPGNTFRYVMVKDGGDIYAGFDGRLVHRWSDPDPHGSGWVGMRTWETTATYEEWSVYTLDDVTFDSEQWPVS